MRPSCPYCHSSQELSDRRMRILKAGFFRRTSDGKRVRRFYCVSCSRYFSYATFHPCFRQKKRHLNHRINKLLASSVSQRRIAKLLHISRTTVERKFLFLGQKAVHELEHQNKSSPLATVVEFDELETFEHTKCKPLSVPLAVESKTRRILSFQVAQMPAKGKLARISRKKYGPRPDFRPKALSELCESLKPLTTPDVHFKSDQNPMYPEILRRHFPLNSHERFKGQRGSIVGQGELKKIRFDPLFSLNHTCAMLRANINRLVRKTWCTTKIPNRLRLHLAIYAVYHNNMIRAGPLAAG